MITYNMVRAPTAYTNLLTLSSTAPPADTRVFVQTISSKTREATIRRAQAAPVRRITWAGSRDRPRDLLKRLSLKPILSFDRLPVTTSSTPVIGAAPQ